MANSIDRIRPDDDRVASRFIEVDGHKWRMCSLQDDEPYR
jgi:hypothetical protein